MKYALLLLLVCSFSLYFQSSDAIQCLGGFIVTGLQPIPPILVDCPSDFDRCAQTNASILLFRIVSREYKKKVSRN